MSAQTLQLFAVIKEKFAAVANNPEIRAKVTATDIAQYNITLDGKVALTFVMNMKDFVLSEVPTANDIEITITDEDVLNLWQNKASLLDLKAAGKITITGDDSLLAVIDERQKRHAAAAAAAAAAK